MYRRVTGIATEAEQAAKTARVAAEGARAAIARLQGSGSSDGPVPAIVADLQQTLSSTRDTMANLAESTEALKRNVLVRGFFDDRGFYDLNDITTVDYRQGALAGEHREPIRIWLRADLLFATAAASPQDNETLSDGGRVRLDRAMAEVLRYPKDTPLIVEGYAAGTRAMRALVGPPSARECASNHQALWVTPTLVGTMPMGERADGPNGAEWDGVSLTVWVDRRALVAKSNGASVK